MTFGILITHAFKRHNKETNKLKKLSKFKSEYRFLGYYYDHKHDTHGFVFEEGKLERFVRKYHQDPVELFGDLNVKQSDYPKNWADDFANKFKSIELIAFEAKHKFLENHIIHKNYDRFEVYIKR